MLSGLRDLPAVDDRQSGGPSSHLGFRGFGNREPRTGFPGFEDLFSMSAAASSASARSRDFAALRNAGSGMRRLAWRTNNRCTSSLGADMPTMRWTALSLLDVVIDGFVGLLP